MIMMSEVVKGWIVALHREATLYCVLFTDSEESKNAHIEALSKMSGRVVVWEATEVVPFGRRE